MEAEAIVMFELIYDRYRERPDEKSSGVLLHILLNFLLNFSYCIDLNIIQEYNK